MSEWINPIYDRTRADVEEAVRKIAEWLKARASGANVTTVDLKGCLNVSDISRIEGNIAYLGERLTALGYTPSISIRQWNHSGIPNVADIHRIIANIHSLILAFYQPPSAPTLPNRMSAHDDINAIEHNLALLKKLIDTMESSFKVSGTFSAGGNTHLPIRR